MWGGGGGVNERGKQIKTPFLLRRLRKQNAFVLPRFCLLALVQGYVQKRNKQIEPKTRGRKKNWGPPDHNYGYSWYVSGLSPPALPLPHAADPRSNAQCRMWTCGVWSIPLHPDCDCRLAVFDEVPIRHLTRPSFRHASEERFEAGPHLPSPQTDQRPAV
jgi:hypothetical protein